MPRLHRVLAAGLSVGIASLLCLGFFALGAVAGVGSSPGARAPSAGELPPERSVGVDHSVTVGGSQGPHPGTLEIWENTGGGPSETDPSVCYYAVCQEPIANVYETLVAYNGSDAGPTPSNFVPELATCVPGSPECASQFGGDNLTWANNTTGAPQYYTFEIDAGARFYDSASGVGWPVYPSDVVFSFARTMAFADLPYEEATAGWINTQDLVGAGSLKWDGGIHAPLNNTPQSILSAFLVNDSAFCPLPTVALATNGCVTFNVGASGEAWPFFLNLIADNLGASIEPCGWYSAHGGGVPGFNGTYASTNGDGPCWLPGNSTSTTDPGFLSYLENTPAKAWDTFEMEANNIPAIQPGVQWSDVGSGPYSVENPIDPDMGYTLHANPDYHVPVGCAGRPGCMPVKGTYAANVDVVWEASGDTEGLNEMAAGQADSAGFFSTDTQTVQALGDYRLAPGIPAMTIFFDPFGLNFSLTGLLQLDPGNISIPSNFFQNVALRQFLVNSYPYGTIDLGSDTVNGTVFGEPYGGAIPHGTGEYYPVNVSWPAGDPSANASEVGNVSWWWAEATTPNSSWYDPQLSNCTVSSPCQWPMISVLGDSVLNWEFKEWDSEIFSLSGGALDPYVFDYYPQTICPIMCTCEISVNCFPVYSWGWVADYPDPSDFMAPMYYPNNSYTAPDEVSETLESAPNNASTCPNDYGEWSNLTYWANVGQIPTDCQGAAYDTMVAWMNASAYETNVPYRILEYNLIEHIANELALYVYDPQQLTVVDYADWIEGSTLNTNPMNGGEGIQLWYGWGYASNYFDATFNEAGLAIGTNWSVTVAGVTENTTAPNAISFGPFVNGTYPYEVGVVPGYLVSSASGNVTINGTAFARVLVFTPQTQLIYTVSFQETGLKDGAQWSVVVAGPLGGATVRGGTSALNISLIPGSYAYSLGPVTGYFTPAGGMFNVTDQSVTVNITYVSTTPLDYPVSFTETGLPSGSSWSIDINGSTVHNTTPTISVNLPNGSYSWGVASQPVGYAGHPSCGSVVVEGNPTSVSVIFAGFGPGPATVPPPPWNYFSPLAWMLVGGLAIGALALAGLYRWRVIRRRSPRTGW